MKQKLTAAEVKQPNGTIPITQVVISNSMAVRMIAVAGPISANRQPKKLLLEMCSRCNQPIGLDCKNGEKRITSKVDPSSRLLNGDLSAIQENQQKNNFHQKCFTCHTCLTPLISKPFYRVQGNLYCDKCMDLCFSDNCARCHQPIRRYSNQQEGQLSSMDGKRNWHCNCFRCYKCNRSLLSGAGIYNHENNDGLFCRDCYDELTAKVCIRCKNRICRYSRNEKLISSPDGMTNFCDKCYRCSNCQNSLLDLGGYYRHRDGGIYCEPCFSLLDVWQ